MSKYSEPPHGAGTSMPDDTTRVGLVARADNRGLGQQTWAVFRNLHPYRTLVVDCPSQNPLTLHFDRFPGAKITQTMSRDDVVEFLDGLDVVYTAETGYSQHLWREAHRMGVRTVLHANYEFWQPTDHPTKLVAASTWNLDKYPSGTDYLPVPIETDRCIPHRKHETATSFLHVIGRPAIKDRNGTLDLLYALQFVKSRISVTITCQQSGYVGGLINQYGLRIPNRVDLTIDSVDALNYWEKYAGHDVLVMPRRFGGLCLPANEALGCGMPVIMPDIPPNNTWLPREWLVKASQAGQFMAKQPVVYYRTNPEVLAERIDAFATQAEQFNEAVYQALNLRDEYSWPTLERAYRQVL
jgi:glycosyltransferase involved in cell wall biosynthesis